MIIDNPLTGKEYMDENLIDMYSNIEWRKRIENQKTMTTNTEIKRTVSLSNAEIEKLIIDHVSKSQKDIMPNTIEVCILPDVHDPNLPVSCEVRFKISPDALK